MFSFASFLITFRETLEAALVVGIILAYLKQTQNTRYVRPVVGGIGVGVLMAIGLAILFESKLGGFEGRTEELFEGTVMLVAAALITTMIFWMKRQRSISEKLRNDVQSHIERQYPLGLFLLSTLSVGREGVETVIFLNAAEFAGDKAPLLSGTLGILSAIVVGVLLFQGAQRLPLRSFFNITSVFLILFAGGLIAHGVHEFQEAGVLPFLEQTVWDLNPPVTDEGVYPPLHENGVVGSFLKVLFGYNGNPSALELMTYLIYLGLIGAWIKKPTPLVSNNSNAC